MNASLDGRPPGWLLLPRKSLREQNQWVSCTHQQHFFVQRHSCSLCSLPLLWLCTLRVHSFVAWVTLSFVPVRMGSSAMYCKGRARWGKQTIPKCHCCLYGCWAAGRLIGCMGTCSAQKSGLVALRDIPRALLPCAPGQRVQAQVRPGAEAANLGHLLDNFQSLLANGDGAVFLLAVSHVSTVPPQVTSTLCCHAVLGARQAVFSLRTGTKWQISAL